MDPEMNGNWSLDTWSNSEGLVLVSLKDIHEILLRERKTVFDNYNNKDIRKGYDMCYNLIKQFNSGIPNEKP